MELRGAAVAVTGATGFLGRYLVDVLLDRGARVIGVVRNPDRVPELTARGVELRRADLADRRWQGHEHANVQGTENVFRAVAAAGVKRVVHVSSVAVYRGHHPPVDE